MTDDGSLQNQTQWPLPKFYFSVSFGFSNTPIQFQEITGLETETQEIEYRHGASDQFSTIKMPGITKWKNITLKKGVFVKDNNFYHWYNHIAMNTMKRETVIINLLDEQGNAIMTWTLNNAWPTKITSTDLKSDGNEVAIESIELAYEAILISNS